MKYRKYLSAPGIIAASAMPVLIIAAIVLGHALGVGE